MEPKLRQVMKIIGDDPAVENVVGFTGGRQTNTGSVYVALKPLSQRSETADEVIARLRPKLNAVPGGRLYLQSVQDIRVGGRQSNAQYQFTLLGDSTAELYTWAPRLTQALQNVPELEDVNSDQQQGGLEANVDIDRGTAARLGITPSQIDNTLYDAYGQRLVSTIYNPLNQYYVVMEVAPRYWQHPETLDELYVSTSGGTPSGTQSTNAVAGTVSTATSSAVPASPPPQPRAAQIAADSARNLAINSLAASGHSSASAGTSVSTALETMIPFSTFARWDPGHTPLGVNHQGNFVATTISFNLPPNEPLSTAVAAIDRTMAEIRMPGSIHGGFQGTARTFQQSLSDEPLLILAALAAVYIVLGILYESYAHPLTILSTLPSAGVGALLALMAFHVEFTVMSLIGVILLIGIVKKNAIMMVDFAIDAERDGHVAARRDLSRQPDALQADHDDDLRRAARRAAAGVRPRRGRRSAPAARHFDCRRPDRQPVAHALHDAGGLSVYRPPAVLDALAGPAPRGGLKPPPQ